MKPSDTVRRGPRTSVWLAGSFLAAAISVTGTSAVAADGAYLGLGLGGGLLTDLDDSDGFTSEFWPGPVVSAAAGYKWRRLRFEGELLYALFVLDDQTGADGTRPPPPPTCLLCGTTGIGGSLSTLAFMANGYFDVDLGKRVRLFLGGGIGWANVAADYHFTVTVLGLPTDQEIDVVDDRDSVLAYQARVGLGFGLDDRSEIYLGYRYFATQDLHFGVSGGGRLRQDGVRSQFAEVGYRFHF